MMKESTKKTFEDIARGYMNKGSFTMEGWETIIRAEANIGYSTFRRYAKLEKVITKIEYTLEEIVDQLNECAGADCYGCDWHYEIIDGKVYLIDVSYKWVGMKEN